MLTSAMLNNPGKPTRTVGMEDWAKSYPPSPLAALTQVLTPDILRFLDPTRLDVFEMVTLRTNLRSAED